MIQHITDNERALTAQVAELTADLRDMRDYYMRACKVVSDMHMAATGGVVGPVLGVIEDVAALRAERDSLKADAERDRWLVANGLFAQPQGYDTQIGICAENEPNGILFVSNVSTHISSKAIDAAMKAPS